MGPQSCYSRIVRPRYTRPVMVPPELGAGTLFPSVFSPFSYHTGNSSSKKGLTVELQNVIERVRGEFNEMPGLRLTPEQAARLWGLDAGSCNQVLRSLVSSSFLRWSAGSVVRAA